MNICILFKPFRYLTRVAQKVLNTSRSNPWDIRAFPFQYSEPMFFNFFRNFIAYAYEAKIFKKIIL